jgi:hypothetical protein
MRLGNWVHLMKEETTADIDAWLTLTAVALTMW